MDNQSYSYEYTKEELKGYDSTRLQQICSDRKIGGGSLSKKKKESILLILNNQEQRKNQALLEAPTKQYYVGTVNYALPVQLIIKIFRFTWDELLDSRQEVDLSLPLITDRQTRYRMALYLASVNKQLFNVVSTFGSSLQLSYCDLDHMTLVSWNALKRPTSVTMIHYNFDRIFSTKYPSVQETEILSGVTKLSVFYGSFGISKQSLVQMSNMLQGLVSFTAGMMVLDKSDFKVLASIQTLVKINIKYITYEPEWIYQKGGDLVLELVKLLDRPMIKLIMPVKYRLGLTVNPILQDSVETYGAASFGEEQLVSYKNLRKFICSGNQTLSNNHNNMSHLNNITHLCAELALRETNSKENWIKVISSFFVSLTTLENLSKKNTNPNGSLDFEIASRISNPLFKYYIVRIQDLKTLSSSSWSSSSSIYSSSSSSNSNGHRKMAATPDNFDNSKKK
ncbi:hypothetical protein DFA_03831 [Cavenderia fasciculata]|uniref:Uncharacterized protein n=1 Tax=Cavenderia fasciculata TaxID=261658 RepID=F4Q0I6_CACFS|nr:uncharacterized protein DFA_03831 [Cavenderia fasciculata]EGG18337.1 hypothetical protein DFA_03831 [Cavenderia fasciculata]|eukprot:XP_004366241.1 hypothetical protein DFA_03831 [Cavenderia fasciculata]